MRPIIVNSEYPPLRMEILSSNSSNSNPVNPIDPFDLSPRRHTVSHPHQTTLPACMCLLCGHVWVPRSFLLPRRCPPTKGCGSPNWNRGRSYRTRGRDRTRDMDQDQD